MRQVLKGKSAGSRVRRRKLRRTIFLLPSLFTVGNLFAGFFALIATLNGHYNSAAVAIGIAVVLDGIDGRVARMANASSDFGLQLDSLADVISFGVAPAVLIYTWGLSDLGNFARFSSFVFLICGAMRLARFNVQLPEMNYFAGLPIPAGAGVMAAIVHLFKEPPQTPSAKFLLVTVTYLVALLMISTIRYPSLKRLNLSGNKSHLTVLILALTIAGVIWFSELALMLLATVYVSSGLVARSYQFFRRRFSGRESAAERELSTEL